MQPRYARFLGLLTPNPRCGWHAAWMGYVVFGAGAIGAVVGGRLFQAGFDVTLIARGVHLQRYKRTGCDLSHRRTPKRSALRRWAIRVRSTGVRGRSS
jgi:choline dehydrogenase-like flavoprotein